MTATATATADLDGDVLVNVDVRPAQLSSRSADTRSMLSFQRFGPYVHAVAFLAIALEVIADLPPGQANIADQLRRAAHSTQLNIAEGAGRWSKPEMKKHYAIARGSAMEAAAALDVLKVQSMIAGERYEAGMGRLTSIVEILTKILNKD